MRPRIIPLAVLATLLLLASAVSAAATQAGDPDDVAGKLDLKELVVGKADSTAPLRVRLETYEGWKRNLLCDCGDNRLVILFDVDSDSAADYVGKISQADDGKLYLYIKGEGSSFEPLPVRHPEDDVIKTVVPGDSPPNPSGTVRIAARSTYYSATGACDDGCKDRAPNGGWLAVS
ncbi:MAG: hypothetical protein HYU54_05065 [Actinobacteria bacterium]|nr:hypothetical protein [Actinomycetota bacterium]